MEMQRDLHSAEMPIEKDCCNKSVIWTLTVDCITGNWRKVECIRTIEIESSDSLYDLHEAIQDAIDFGRDHPFEFHAGRNYRNCKVLYYEIDGQKCEYANFNTKLEDVYPLPKSCKFYYHFDFGDDWYFEIRRSRKKPHKPEVGVRYPRVIEAIGDNPVQYPPLKDDFEF